VRAGRNRTDVSGRKGASCTTGCATNGAGCCRRH
jgi:hypothetical protein